MINKNNYPTFAWILDYWPVMILLPSLLLLVAVLALITRWWDERDQTAAAQKGAQAGTTLKPPSTGAAEHRRSMAEVSGDHERLIQT